ncbi:MAG: YeeE/YedE family protein [Acidiferrobacterales bacterium]|nr:YeeE/YedE family protein [Acidiferrobacterales bacterium]
MNKLSSLFCGLLFGLGLAASGMTDTTKVIGFLDVFGQWDPDLLFVMGAAVITTVIGFYIISKTQNRPLFAIDFSLPSSHQIDLKLILGAILFGIGWGLYGYCPGPAVAAVVYLRPITAIFILAMLLGMAIGNKLSIKIQD